MAGGIPRIMRRRRAGTEAWIGADPVLDDGEIATDIITKRSRIGDGVRPWSQLPEYAEDDRMVQEELPAEAMHRAVREEIETRLGAATPDLLALYILAKS